ncbi:conserved Plasmodium protein, unknown function [Plasmodium knowlesi strain H]|uniref:Uncharacterized protein n=3 Tax=Plasmodium knowlesi TaxID=5850 RepID=A0A5K1VSN9_PLAKH|nr:conserved Plasmodium protein, unknown function [Plasmodium knowlesi strain H]OTN68706.1 Uncharacterized protein PKNOH_S01017000 [Plasmodium knowlesi]CAA9986167.1 conserved Plasmodium protein, unknown function [Plasmodium knowlesi strain H]SBO25360.1 conserved Plasmodium protein, unknown function [Plasmodium knowlesi strain H]VVS75641.1 conserved Plasmodium protein, unknown function [Plasmodium knowlesi strain H]|eukprot:XP_002257578.1 hypothetical protein, conserved in Plasmodium species [Plasmodium knowlesi strain H]
MEDANDIIKEIIYRSADECNYNNEELNFPTIMKQYYDVTRKYSTTNQLSREILNKLVIICKNIIHDKVSCEYPLRVHTDGREGEEEYIPHDQDGEEEYIPHDQDGEDVHNLALDNNNLLSMQDIFSASQDVFHYKHYDQYEQRQHYDQCEPYDCLPPTGESVQVCRVHAERVHISREEGTPYSENIPYEQRFPQGSLKMTTLRRKGPAEETTHICELSPPRKFSIVAVRSNQTERSSGMKGRTTKGGRMQNKLKGNPMSLCNVQARSNMNPMQNEKSFMHKNNRNLLKIYLNGELLCNIYDKLTKKVGWGMSTGGMQTTSVQEKVKLYNEANVFFTFKTLRKLQRHWVCYARKKKELRKRADKYDKLYKRKLLAKFYELWLYRNEKKIYIKGVFEKMVEKRKKNLLRKQYNVWMCKYKKKKKKNFIYLVHIFSEWRTYAEKEKTLQRAKQKVERQKKKEKFVIWKERYRRKLIKKKKNEQIQSVYNKNLIIKCYVHFALYHKKRKRERQSFRMVSFHMKEKLSHLYFSLLVSRYKEEVEFRNYYSRYLKKVKKFHLKKFFSIFRGYVQKRRNLKRSYNFLARQNSKNVLSVYFNKWVFTLHEARRITTMLSKHFERRSHSLQKKFFLILRRHKNKSFSLKKRFIVLYEKKNQVELLRTFQQWKKRYTINATQYILLHSKYKYKLIIRCFSLLRDYKNYRKRRKHSIEQMRSYFVNRVKKRTLSKWIDYVRIYKRDILHYYHFNDQGNFFLLFMLKTLLQCRLLSPESNGKTLLDIVNFSNINFNLNNFVFIHKKYLVGKGLLPNIGTLYDNAMFVYRSLNIISSFVPVPFAVSLRKLRHNLPYLCFALKMAIYKRVVDTWRNECMRIKRFRAECRKELQRSCLSRFRGLVRKKKALQEAKKKYDQEQKMQIKSKIFSTWLSLRMKYYTFRRKFQCFGLRNRQKKMKKIIQGWVSISREKREKKKKILLFFKSVLMRKKKKYFDCLLRHVHRRRKKKVKEKIANLYYVRKYKSRAFKALFLYSKNLLFFNALNTIAESYLKQMCVRRWRHLTRAFLEKRQEIRAAFIHLDMKLKRRFFNIFFIYVRLRNMRRTKIAHVKRVQAKFLTKRFLEKWKNYVQIRRNKEAFLSNMISLFNRKKKLQIISKWYTRFILNVRLKEMERIISWKVCLVYFAGLLLYSQKMKRVELFLRSRTNVVTCQRMLKKWRRQAKLQIKKKKIIERRVVTIKSKYYTEWKKKYQKVRRKKKDQLKIQSIRHIGNANTLRKVNHLWRIRSEQSRNIKRLIHATYSFVIKKCMSEAFVAVYRCSHYYVHIEVTLTNFLVEKKEKMKRKIWAILKRNRSNRLRNRKAAHLFSSILKIRAFSALQLHRRRQSAFKRGFQVLTLKRKKKYFNAMLHFFEFIKRAKFSFYSIRINGERRLQRHFFLVWMAYLTKRKQERKIARIIQRQKANRIKGAIFFQIKRRINRTRYLMLLLHRMEDLMKAKMYQQGVYKIRAYRKIMIIREKILSKLQKDRHEKTIRKVFNSFKERLAKSRRTKLEKDLINRFYSKLIMKKYFRFISQRSHDLSIRRNAIVREVDAKSVLHRTKRHFLWWKTFVKRKRLHRKLYNAVKLQKKARVFITLLHVKAQNCYKKVALVHRIHALVYPSRCSIPPFEEILDCGHATLRVDPQGRNYNCVGGYKGELSCSYNRRVASELNFTCEESARSDETDGTDGSNRSRENELRDNIGDDVKIEERLTRWNTHQQFKTLIQMNRMDIQMGRIEKKNHHFIIEKRSKRKNSHFYSYQKVCYSLMNTPMNRLMILYLLMFDLYDINTLFDHFKKKFNFLYHFFFNFLSLKTKKLLLKVFKRKRSFSYFQVVNGKDSDLNTNFKLILLVYYLLGRSVSSAGGSHESRALQIFNATRSFLGGMQERVRVDTVEKVVILNKPSNTVNQTHTADEACTQVCGGSSTPSSSEVDTSLSSQSSGNGISSIGMSIPIKRTPQMRRLASGALQRNLIDFVKTLKSGIATRFRETTLSVHFSIMCSIGREKLIQVHLFFSRLKRCTQWWRQYSLVRSQHKKEDSRRVATLEKKKKNELLEKFFGIWVLSFNCKVKEIKTKRKQVLKKHIRLLFSYWHGLIKVGNYDKEKFLKLKEQVERRVKKNYLERYISVHMSKKSEKRNFSIVMKHSNEKRKRTFFYVWLLLYRYEQKGCLVRSRMQRRILRCHFDSWLGIYAKKQIYLLLIRMINEHFLRKLFTHVVHKFKYYSFIKGRALSTLRRCFLVHYNLVKRNVTITKLQVYICASVRFSQMKHLFELWSKKYRKRKSCRESYSIVMRRKKRVFFHKWVKHLLDNSKLHEEKIKKWESFYVKSFFSKWMTYHHYKKVKNRRRRNILQFYFRHLRRTFQMSVSLREYTRKAKLTVTRKIFSMLRENKLVRVNRRRIHLYCEQFSVRTLLRRYYSLWANHYLLCKHVKSIVCRMTLIRNTQLLRRSLNGWLLYTQRTKQLQEIHNVIKFKRNKVVQIIFNRWRNLYEFAMRKRKRSIQNFFLMWIHNFKFCSFINRLNLYVCNIYTKNIFCFYFDLRSMTEKYNLLARGSFPFVKQQIAYALACRTELLSCGFKSLKDYAHHCKAIRIKLETCRIGREEKLKKRYLSLLLAYKKKKKKKMHLHNLLLKYTIERKFHKCRTIFFILTNVFFYNNHLRLCEKTIQCRRNRRTLLECLDKWTRFKNYTKENEYLQNLSNDFLTYRRKSECIISFKHFYVERKWMNYCEYNSLVYYKSVQEKMVARVITHWHRQSLLDRQLTDKGNQFKERHNRNMVKKFFFLLIFSINKIKIEKKNFDIVRFKREKIIKHRIINFMRSATLTCSKKLDLIHKTIRKKKEENLLRTYGPPFLQFIIKKKNLRRVLIDSQRRNDNTLTKKYFYSLIFKYVTNVNHYKYYYYNKYLSLWKYYVVIGRTMKQQAHGGDTQEGENHGGNSDEELSDKPFDNPSGDGKSDDSSECTLTSVLGLRKGGKGDLQEYANLDSISSSIASSETKEESDTSDIVAVEGAKL